ncbi:MAG TPA: GNAT family N-acetyltransferase [Tepidisphaeraceae bacterium]|nr:GNAT family N-acetyltransferase [Tepidisphaeraceae bacterium]
MEIRAATQSDLDGLREIDGTVESAQYLHLERTGEGFASGWQLEQRPARQKTIEPNRLDDDAWFTLKQVAGGIEEGMALMIEHDDQPVAMLLARPDPAAGTLRIVDLRVDYDYRRQGMGTALVFHLIQMARDGAFRAIGAEALTNNLPANALLARCGFELSGVDTRRRTNHDLVKEAVTLFWYVPLD